MKEISYKNQFGDTLYGHSWEIENPEKIVLLVTGMAEHSARYDDFATFLNKNGISVYCLDHYGQGEKNGELGNPPVDYFSKMVETMSEYAAKLKKDFEKPVYIFSHSMGSFITQSFIEKHSNEVDKVIICGTNGRNVAVKAGKVLTKIAVHKKNYGKKATFFHNIAIGAYTKAVKDRKTENDWLSYNEENVARYNADPLSGYRCTNGFYREFMKGLASIQKDKNIANINKDLPILFIAGAEDPVGANGKGPRSLNEIYKKHGLNSNCIIYEHMRHEILNELDHQKVYDDILEFYKK